MVRKGFRVKPYSNNIQAPKLKAWAFIGASLLVVSALRWKVPRQQA